MVSVFLKVTTFKVFLFSDENTSTSFMMWRSKLKLRSNQTSRVFTTGLMWFDVGGLIRAWYEAAATSVWIVFQHYFWHFVFFSTFLLYSRHFDFILYISFLFSTFHLFSWPFDFILYMHNEKNVLSQLLSHALIWSSPVVQNRNQ